MKERIYPVVMITGSRSITSKRVVWGIINQFSGQIGTLIHGGAKGVDQLARDWAIANDIPEEVFKPDWAKYGKAAGLKRNRQMVDACEYVIAIWDGESNGTRHAIQYAWKKGVGVNIFRPK